MIDKIYIMLSFILFACELKIRIFIIKLGFKVFLEDLFIRRP